MIRGPEMTGDKLAAIESALHEDAAPATATTPPR